MKTYKATFWRGNPQLKTGWSTRTYTIEARSLKSAERKAREIEARVTYGTLSLARLEEVQE